MTEGKNKLDDNVAVLLKRAVANQLEMGIGDFIINRENIVRKKGEAASRSLTMKKSIESKIYASLESHQKDICGCLKCPLGGTRTKFVYGAGNSRAKVMFIGEAPGREDDLKGEPFVGRAGQLLDKILEAIKFSRNEQVYIANILKCRPPNNRDPQPDEMKTCMPYLLEQIRLVNPKIICALGRIAAQALLDTTTPLGKLRQRWHQFAGIPFIVTYHPAALLRFQSYKKDCWEDMKMLKAKYDELMQE